MPASIPIKQGDAFASRLAIRPRASFSRKTIVPCSSKPIKWNVFLPVSMPIVLTATAFVFCDMAACSSCFEALPDRARARPVHPILDAATTVHWHGLLVPGENDGGPQRIIQPGERWRPVLKIDQPAATLWFHPHPHGDTARQIYMGLAAMMIVDDGSDARLGLPRTFGVDDLPIILQDRSFASDGSIEYE